MLHLKNVIINSPLATEEQNVSEKLESDHQ